MTLTRHTITKLAILGLSALTLAACEESADDRNLLVRLTDSSTQSPEEFSIVPNRPLELPEDLAALPAPRPGTTSRSDLTPRQDVLAALGGRPGGSGGDQTLLVALGATQVDPDIRTRLARESQDFRENNPGLIIDRLMGRMTEPVIFESQTLDPVAEVERLRRQGVWVPQMAPPQ